jgi:nicotinamidase-related amidase
VLNAQPIGIADASIVLLDRRAAPRKLAPPAWREARTLESPQCGTALLVIDMQAGFDDPAWGERNNPMAEANVAALVEGCRAMAIPVIHVHHDSPAAVGRLRPGTPGNAPKPQTAPRDGEPVYRKRVNSAFIGTSLEADLLRQGVKSLIIVGLTTNHCISTSARMAGNLGFATFVVADATAAFASEDIHGRLRSAEDVHTTALSDLRGEFAEIVETQPLLAWLRARRPGRRARRTTNWLQHF